MLKYQCPEATCLLHKSLLLFIFVLQLDREESFHSEGYSWKIRAFFVDLLGWSTGSQQYWVDISLVVSWLPVELVCPSLINQISMHEKHAVPEIGLIGSKVPQVICGCGVLEFLDFILNVCVHAQADKDTFSQHANGEIRAVGQTDWQEPSIFFDNILHSASYHHLISVFEMNQKEPSNRIPYDSSHSDSLGKDISLIFRWNGSDLVRQAPDDPMLSSSKSSSPRQDGGYLGSSPQNSSAYSQKRRKLNKLYEELCIRKEQIKPSSTSKLIRVQTANTNIELKAANYKVLLGREIQKNKELQHRIHNIENKYIDSTQLVIRLKKQNEQLTSKLEQGSKVKAKHCKTIVELQEQLRKTTKVTKLVTRPSANFEKQELYRLRQQNGKLNAFVNALKESVRILKGKTVNDLAGLWNQWRLVFEQASLKECKL